MISKLSLLPWRVTQTNAPWILRLSVWHPVTSPLTCTQLNFLGNKLPVHSHQWNSNQLSLYQIVLIVKDQLMLTRKKLLLTLEATYLLPLTTYKISRVQRSQLRLFYRLKTRIRRKIGMTWPGWNYNQYVLNQVHLKYIFRRHQLSTIMSRQWYSSKRLATTLPHIIVPSIGRTPSEREWK